MKKLNKGFTMIELLIVIAIIGILATTLAPKLIKEIRKATVAKVQHNLGVIRSRLSLDETLLDEFPDLAGDNNTTTAGDDDPDLLKAYSIEPTPPFTDENGVSREESSEVINFRNDEGGWYYIRETGEIYANLPNGAYTRDAEYEIWNGEDIEGDEDTGGEEVKKPNGPVGDDWDKFIEGGIKENTNSYGELYFTQGDNGNTITPQEWHGDSNDEYWKKVFVYDENKNLIKNPDSDDGSYNYKEAIDVSITGSNNSTDYIAVLERTDLDTGEKVYLYSNPK